MASICQSCGMPLNKDPEGGGTNTDGTRSDTYCSLCFHEGAFIHPDFTVSEMQAHCIEQLKEKGMPTFMGWLFTRSIPNLYRWKTSGLDQTRH